MYVCTMEKKYGFLLALKLFAKDIVVPEALVADSAKAETSDDVKRFCMSDDTTLNALEQGTPQDILVELFIGMLKFRISKDMKERNSPIRLWDYCAELCASTHNMTSRNTFKLQCLTPHAAITWKQSDVNNFCQFCWFEWIYCRDDKKNFPEREERPGKPQILVKVQAMRCVSGYCNLLKKEFQDLQYID